MIADRARDLANQVEQTAEATPAKRERHVDLVRAMAIALVVLGHWLVVAVTETNGVIDGVNALEELGWAHPVTWVFQVMPLFFFIGGYANAASLQANREAGGDSLGWVLSRFERIVVPTTALLVVLVAAVGVARLAGVGHDPASTGAWLASVPMWFLAAYLGVLAFAPFTEALSRRFGLAVPASMAVGVVLADLASIGAEWEAVGNLNHLLMWMAVHQLGYAWREGLLSASPATGLPLVGVGLLAAVLLTTVGPYPTSMVGVPGDELQNSAPPTAALLALGIAQIGLVLALRNLASSWLRRWRVWVAVVAVNSVMLTLFLWHMAAALVTAVAVYASGLMPTPAIDSAPWLLLRIPWLAACAVVLAVLVALFAGIEVGMPGARKGSRIESRAALASGWLGVALVLSGMLGIALAGEGAHGALGLPTEALAAYAAGCGGLLVAARGRSLASTE
jgi:fucose 4-O-acetylase-like acetyltransferase